MKTNEVNISLYAKKFGKSAKNARKDDWAKMRKKISEELKNNSELLFSAYNCWLSLAQWRKDVRRNEEFVFGDQFKDRVFDHDACVWKTERLLYQEQGLNPSQYNIIRNIIRTIIGVWTSNDTLPTCVAQKDENQHESEVLTATLHALYRKNEMDKFTIAQLLQILISGAALSENIFTTRDSEKDIFNNFIDPFALILDNTMKDPRYTDCSIVGYFVDLPLKVIAGTFSKGNRARAERIRRAYGSGRIDEERVHQISETFTDARIEMDFFTPPIEAYGLHRVYKIFRKESAECFWVHDKRKGTYKPMFKVTEAELKAENENRKKEMAEQGVDEEDMHLLLLDYKFGVTTFWKYYFLTPYGDVLDDGRVKDWHEKPSIIFELHDFFIGKIYPFVTDLIDTQKQINQLSAISALLTKFSAKSLLIMHEDTISENYGGLKHVSKEAARMDGIVVYGGKKGEPRPHYENTVAQAFTPLNVVNMYLKLSENISGVFGALQGSQPTAGTPAAMYAQQSQNSATSLLALFKAMNSFKTRNAKMMVQLMQQYYTEKRYIFDQTSGERVLWNPEQVRNIDFEISIVENTSTPAYRLMVNEVLMQLKQFDTENLIDLKGLLEVGNFPFSAKLIDYLNKRGQEREEMMKAMQAGEQMQGAPMHQQIPPELQQEMAQYQFSPEVLDAFSKQSPSMQESILQQVAVNRV